MEKWLLVNFKINRLPALHIADRYMTAATALGIQYDGKGLDFFIAPTATQEAQTFLNNLALSGFDATAYTAVVIGATAPTKVPTNHWYLRLLQKLSGSVLLIGGPDEQTKGEELAHAAGKQVRNAAGVLSIGASAELIRRAAAVISPDTGMMHIAAAFRQKIIVLWGNTVPEFGMSPYLPKGEEDKAFSFEIQGLSCRPCSKLGYKHCPKGHFACMENLNEIEVVEKLIQLKKKIEA